jgi:hypothetical protein
VLLEDSADEVDPGEGGGGGGRVLEGEGREGGVGGREKVGGGGGFGVETWGVDAEDAEGGGVSGAWGDGQERHKPLREIELYDKPLFEPGLRLKSYI